MSGGDNEEENEHNKNENEEAECSSVNALFCLVKNSG
jgi:hypothetical protein